MALLGKETIIMNKFNPEQGQIIKATTNEEIVALLKDDMKGEHAAIVQYLQHAYKLGEGEIPTEVEAIARDEMRHFRWLGELIVELGGDPIMERDPIFLDTPQDFELMVLDIEAEDRAIELYEAHLAAIDHPRVRQVIERILVDERTHKAMFIDFTEELGGDPKVKLDPEVGPWNQDASPKGQDLEIAGDRQTVAVDPTAEGRDDHPMVKLLNNRVRHEYLTVLSYLHRAFISWNSNPHLSRSLIEDHAIWHMTHLGTISEAVAELEETPAMYYGEVPMSDREINDKDYVKWGVENENRLAENTAYLLEKLQDEDEVEEAEDLERQLKRYRKHELFIKQRLQDELEKQQ
jgi:bacterioferritin